MNKEYINLTLANNGVLCDWGDGRKTIYKDNHQELSRFVNELIAFMEGYYSGAFEKYRLSIESRINESHDGPEGIADTERYN